MLSDIPERLQHQLAFLNEAEKLKLVYRRNQTVDRSRSENSAEHSWHIALMALVFSEYAAEPIDMLKVVRMLIIHDLVEISAGDTWVFDEQSTLEQASKEQQSADVLFGMLPPDQTAAFHALWDEFEARATPEAAFAASIDALQPLANHLLSGDPDAGEPKLARERVLSKKRSIETGSGTLWSLAQALIAESVHKGLYTDGPAET